MNKTARLNGLIQAMERELDDPYLQSIQGPGVYLLKCQDLYKIGRAEDLRSRVGTLQTGCPYQISIEMFIPCSTQDAPAIERELHKTYTNQKHRGEWYRLSRSDVMKLKEAELNDCIRQGLNVFLDYINSPDIPQESLKKIRTTADLILSIIRSGASNELNGLIKLEDIIARCESQGKSRDKVMLTVDALRRDGEIIEQRPGVFRILGDAYENAVLKHVEPDKDTIENPSTFEQIFRAYLNAFNKGRDAADQIEIE